MNRIQVVAGILLDDSGQVLIAERTDDGPFQGLWEFPGGKIEAGESAESALARELSEELAIEVCLAKPFLRLDHDYADREVRLHFFRILEWRGRVLSAEGQKLRWLMPADIEEGLMLPADAPVVLALRS